MVLQQLRQAEDDAKRQHLNPDLVLQASTLIQMIEKDQGYEDVAEFKLKRLLALDDPEKIEARLQLAKNRDEAKGPKAQKVVGELEERMSRLQQHEHHQRWFDCEVEVAWAAKDAHRLRQLVSQGRILGLNMSPAAVKLLHSLEDRAFDTQPPAGNSRCASTESLEVKKSRAEVNVTERLNSLIDRKKKDMVKILNYVESDPTTKKFDEAKQAISDAKATKVPLEITTEIEKRFVALEETHGPRLKAEEHLLDILRNSELVTFDGLDGQGDGPVLQDMSNLPVLRQAVADGRKADVVDDLLSAGEALLDRSIAFEVQQRDAADVLRTLLKNPIKDDRKLEELHLAIDQASRCGLPTLHAERELFSLREIQVHREAAEAELREARKGQGAHGRARLEAAIQIAKNAGVNARKLQAANNRMNELDEHHRKCSLIAGNIRRTLPSIDREPWRFQQIVETAQSLQPWTPELDRLVRAATEQLENSIKSQTQQKEVHTELQALLKRIAVGRSNGQTCADDTAQLADVLPRARAAKVREDLLQEADVHLKALKREGCQRNAAEHRLRLALNAKDFGEIERSLREVRALGGMLLENAGSGTARGQSARLMDSANTMLRHLGDMATRRQAAETALLQRIADSDGDPLPFVTAVDSQAGAAVAQQGTEAWVKEVMEIAHEAKQSGVAPSLIEHAKLKIRQKRRERWEEVQAVAALKKTLVKKNASTQELLRNMRKVERFQAKPVASKPEDATTRPQGLTGSQ